MLHTINSVSSLKKKNVCINITLTRLIQKSIGRFNVNKSTNCLFKPTKNDPNNKREKLQTILNNDINFKNVL